MKIIKDPIYGYIEIEKGYLDLINTPSFQRLRDIIQTSYTAVYPATLHNRFTHSLGVFHLGQIAVNSLEGKLKSYYNEYYDKNQKEIKKFSYTFLLACLLHDVGHAPFSHTGEAFFLVKEIWKMLKDELKCKSFDNDYNSAGVLPGAPHEIMSAFVGLKYLHKYFDKNLVDKELFARCIIGLKYNSLTSNNSYKNCLIELIHSDTIDVDRLDYIIRDSFMSGYCSVNIDYDRLLTSIYVTKNKNDLFELSFKKSALSVLENFIIAHDAEKKWLQSHPAILYESCLIGGMIRFAINYFEKSKVYLFSAAALSEEGVGDKKEKIKLLSDSDIISLVKRYGYEEECFKSYFDRSLRRKPFWKTESEYKVLFESRFSVKEGGNLTKIEEYFDTLHKLLNFYYIPVINDNAIKELDKLLKKEKKSSTKQIDKYVGNTRTELLEKTIYLFKQLKNLAKKYGCNLDFVVISSRQFESGFNKDKFKKTPILFHNLDRTEELSNAINILSNDQSRKNFFYFFAPQQTRDKINCVELINVIAEFSQKYLERK